MAYTSQYPPAHNDTYVKATSAFNGSWLPDNATNPAKSLTGAAAGGNEWISGNGQITNQSFHIDLGSGQIIKRIYFENGHEAGTDTFGGIAQGAKNFTFWGTDNAAAFADTTYATDTNWTQLTTSISQFQQHALVDASDPQYAVVTNTTSYRYYRIKFADHWSGTDYIKVRRIELQTAILADTPTNSSPTDEATDVSVNPSLESSAFSSDAEVTHKASQWQIATDSGFSSVVWDSGTSTTNKTSCIVNATNGTFAGALEGETALGTDIAYYFRVRHQDSDDIWSEYSTGTSFTTEAGGFAGALTLNTKWW